MRPAMRRAETTANATNTPAPEAAEDWPNASVLVVDDEAGMRNFLLKTLAPRAAHVLAAGSAEEAEGLLDRKSVV